MKRILDSKADNNRFLMGNDEKLIDIQPRYVYNIVGVMINTSISAVIQDEVNNYNEIVTNRSLLWTNNVSGDGVAPFISANNSGFITLLTTYKQLNHNNLVRNEIVFEDLRQFLGFSCSFEGNWTLSLINGTRNQNLTVRVYTDYQSTYSPMLKMKGIVMSNVWKDLEIKAMNVLKMSIAISKMEMEFENVYLVIWQRIVLLSIVKMDIE
jgi:hypothetical protein